MNRSLARSLPLALVATFAVAGPAVAAQWKLDDAHTDIGFSVRHMMVSDTKGAFDKYSGTIELDDKDLTKSKVEVEMAVDSINTKNEKRDAHLKGEDFFDAQKHPKVTFKSTKITKGKKPNSFQVKGDLTIRGVTKPVVLDAELSDEWSDPKEWGGNVHRGVKAVGKINRRDFGLNWQTKLDKGGVVAGEEVTLLINTELIKVKPQP